MHSYAIYRKTKAAWDPPDTERGTMWNIMQLSNSVRKGFGGYGNLSQMALRVCIYVRFRMNIRRLGICRAYGYAYGMSNIVKRFWVMLVHIDGHVLKLMWDDVSISSPRPCCALSFQSYQRRDPLLSRSAWSQLSTSVPKRKESSLSRQSRAWQLWTNDLERLAMLWCLFHSDVQLFAPVTSSNIVQHH